jgi:hypothetical protein
MIINNLKQLINVIPVQDRAHKVLEGLAMTQLFSMINFKDNKMQQMQQKINNKREGERKRERERWRVRENERGERRERGRERRERREREREK